MARRGRSALASSPERSLARRHQCWLGATPNVELSQLCVVACTGKCERVPSAETNGGVFLLLLQVPTSPFCYQCVTKRPIIPIGLYCPSQCIQYTRDDCGGCLVNGSVWNLGRVLANLVETAWNLEQNGVLLPVKCALLTVNALLHPREVH